MCYMYLYNYYVFVICWLQYHSMCYMWLNVCMCYMYICVYIVWWLHNHRKLRIAMSLVYGISTSKWMYCSKPERILSSVLGGYGWSSALFASAMNIDNHMLKSSASATSIKLSGHFSLKCSLWWFLQAVKVFKAQVAFWLVFFRLWSFRRILLGSTFSIFLPIWMHGLSCCHDKRMQISYNPLPRTSSKIHYSTSASLRPRIVFFLQSSKVGYNYYMYVCVFLLVPRVFLLQQRLQL